MSFSLVVNDRTLNSPAVTVTIIDGWVPTGEGRYHSLYLKADGLPVWHGANISPASWATVRPGIQQPVQVVFP